MSEDNIISENKRFCACGCGSLIVDKWGHHSRYIFGHSTLGRFKKGQYSGSLHLKWKGGRHKHHDGYIMLSARYDHPRAHNGRILEHIVVYEQYHKCCLLRWSNIHHVNGDKTDNRPENLQGMTSAQHTAMHSMIDTLEKRVSNRRCSKCNNKSYIKPNGTPSWYHAFEGSGFLCNICYGRLRRKRG